MKLPKSSVSDVVSIFSDLDVGDPRRTSRVQATVAKLAANPTATFPSAMGSEACIEGGYRLMNSRHITMAKLNEAHAQRTAEQARAYTRVLAIHDTTTCKFPHADASTVGYLNTGKAGFMVHYTLVVAGDCSRRPLGVSNVEVIARSKAPARRKAKGRSNAKKPAHSTAKNKDRESKRWDRGFQSTSACLQGTPVIHVADREGDNYDLFARALMRGERFVVRA